VITVNKIPPA